MFKPIRWKTLPRDFAVIQIGFALFGLAIAMLIHANLGTNPWVMLSVALSDILGLSVGTITVLVGFSVLAVALIMRERVGWGTLSNILFIGPWTDLFLWLIPSVTDSWLMQGAMLLASILIMGMATGIYIGVDAGAGPRDTLMLAVQRGTGWSLRRARGTIELCVFVAGWLLGGPFGIGTIVVALLIGPAVQWGFRLFKVQRAAPAVAERPFVNT
ncbi:MAG: YitT family protein [Ardenticatenaceae bacterium]|nr:YitT family protein [Ardenticatenaceae bacterium]